MAHAQGPHQGPADPPRAIEIKYDEAAFGPEATDVFQRVAENAEEQMRHAVTTMSGGNSAPKLDTQAPVDRTLVVIYSNICLFVMEAAVFLAFRYLSLEHVIVAMALLVFVMTASLFFM
jgi:hypothetical protein